MSVSREESRDLLATLLNGSLSDLVEAVYNYQTGDFEGQSPVVVVTSAGSQRTRLTMRGGQARFKFYIYVFVLYSDQVGWTEADAEDRLDAIEKLIYETIEANQTTETWGAIDYEEEGSDCDSVAIGGVDYRREIIPIAVTVYQ